ncbi:hypothetical protein PHET_04136 [Paragonimus heterotremus]|uniref:Uncharacterized protein n=1 Tax=Paragonimus heterotremus TaxID=100268 RepID=A0A8J4WHT1_9TREM|nr:hypothetical protein PHET_04136 [Paragonimus heterotremus]
MVWIRETFRMITYLALPCAAFTMVNLPYFTERSIAMERLTTYVDSGIDIYPDDPEPLEELREKYKNTNVYYQGDRTRGQRRPSATDDAQS